MLQTPSLVRGLTSYAPEGADIGDVVVSVDGRLVSKVSSAADVERMLTEGRVIRLRKGRKIPVANVARTKSEERLLRSIEELLQTEKKYVDDLKEMIDRYLSIPSVREIMESALRLQKIQISFLDSLEEAVGDIGSRDVSARPLVRVSLVFVETFNYAQGLRLRSTRLQKTAPILHSCEASFRHLAANSILSI
ncbi:unnamed protein product [Nippostrongylus brasiliensis]|uniref:DH domain-containing protein n=1 Tax=Nippostrongylus brasiliensis TaxID=27835 RepID=A0A0N4XIY7_NIPBR|nr:unnamed protein product [Nippostrongylus brasiliensis]